MTEPDATHAPATLSATEPLPPAVVTLDSLSTEIKGLADLIAEMIGVMNKILQMPSQMPLPFAAPLPAPVPASSPLSSLGQLFAPGGLISSLIGHPAAPSTGTGSGSIPSRLTGTVNIVGALLPAAIELLNLANSAHQSTATAAHT
jgi:hypothetical protein